jgi:hypothetical protein
MNTKQRSYKKSYINLQIYNLITLIIVLTAVFGYINFRFIKLPGTIGIMLISLVVSLLVIVIGLDHYKCPLSRQFNCLKYFIVTDTRQHISQTAFIRQCGVTVGARVAHSLKQSSLYR